MGANAKLDTKNGIISFSYYQFRKVTVSVSKLAAQCFALLVSLSYL